jgi:ammonia channel protein AmtB
MTYIILVFVNFFIKLRIDAEEEEDGLDISQHSERVH